jgi:arabinofuranan 3-O-arabinosyltransferase
MQLDADDHTGGFRSVTTDVLDPPIATASPDPRSGRELRRLQLAGVSLILILLTFSQSSGSEAADTKLDLVVTPWRFLAHSMVMWDPTANAGQLQNQAYGYLFPMGPFFLLGHWLHLSPWVVQRAWESTLLVVAFLGTVRLARLLDVAGFWPRVIAGLVYALAPRTLMELGVISSELLPVALAPWVLIPLVAGSRGGSPRRAAARSGVAVLLTGGVNAAATVAILPLPALWLLTRARGQRRGALMRWWSTSVALACLWWSIPLLVLGRYSPPFLDWIESAAVTTSPTSLATTLRGAEHWEAYLGRGVWPTGYVFVAVRAVVLATALVVAFGVAGLASRRVRHRQFLALALGAGLVLLTFGHSSTVGPLVAGHERQALDGVLNAFRNIHKFDTVVRLPIALGAGHATAAVARWLQRERPTVSAREAKQRQWLAVAAALAVGCLAAAPAITGQIIPQPRTLTLPSWWSQTGAWLGQQPGDGRALVVPGAASPVYLWGAPVDDALQPVADGPWTVRTSTPLAQPGYIRLLDEIETRFGTGERDTALASVLARSGIRYVVVRNDIDPIASKTVSPLFVTQTLHDSPGFQLVAHFGTRTPTNDPNRVTDLGATNLPGAVSIFSDTEWTGAVAAEPASNVVHANGSSDELPALVAAGVGPSQPVEFTGAGPDRGGITILDDGLRRREFGFGGIDSYSDTLTATQPFRSVRTVHDYLPSPVPPMSTASYVGVAGITASSSGADVGAVLNRSNVNGPFSAMDGNALTAWRPGVLRGAVNQWLQVDLLHPIDTRSVSASFVGNGTGALPDRVRVQTSTGSRVDDVASDPLPQPLALPPGATRFVRITIEHIADGSAGNSAGIDELNIPGVSASRTLDIPGPVSPDLMTFTVAGGERSACLTVNGAAACNPAWQIAGAEQNTLDRTVDLSAAGTYSANATVRLQSDPAVSDLLDRHSPIAAIASSTDSADPRERAGAAVDGDPATGWVAAGSDKHPDLLLSFSHRVRLRGFRLTPITAAPTAAPVAILVGVNGRLVRRHVPSDGLVSFRRPVTARALSIQVTRSTARITTSSVDGKQRFLPVGIGEVTLQGRRVPVARPARSLTIACRTGPVLAVDGIPVTMSVHGSMTRALQGLPLKATPCATGRRLLQLNAGGNRFRLAANGLVRPQSIQLLNQQDSLTTLAALTPADHSNPAVPRPVHWSATDRSVSVSAPVASLLIVHENFNAGWRATVGGHQLRATTVDGWQQAWLIPAGTNGIVHLVYTPQHVAEAGLVAGAVAALMLLVLAFGWRSRRGVRLPAVGDGVVPATVSAVVILALMLLLGSLVGLGLGAVVLLATRSIRRQGRWATYVAAGTLGLVAGAEFIEPVGSGNPLANSIGVQTLCLLCVAVVLARAFASPRSTPGLREPTK